MSQSTTSLGGITLRGSDSYQWELRAGVLPVERFWPISADVAKDFIPLLGKAQTFKIKGPRTELKVEHVYPIEILPGANPKMRTLRVADRRIWWPRYHVATSFNVRKVATQNFLVNDSGLIENAILQPDIRYRAQTLYPPESPGTPWTAQQALEFVMAQVETPMRVSGTLTPVDVLDLPLDDPGDAAVDKVVSYQPGADVFIDYDGTAVFYDTLAGSGKEVLDRFARRQVTASDIGISFRPEFAPSAIHVLFTVEQELRLNYDEDGTRVRDSNTLENVAQSPDATVTLTTGDKVARGTLVPLSILFATWGAFGVLGAALSFEILCRFGYAAGLLEQFYANNPDAAFDPVNAARYRAAQDAWRRLYQIDERFMSRIESVRAVRAATLNVETGQRAPAEAYCDYTRRPSAWGLAKVGAINPSQGWAVRGYATRLEDGQAAPSRVTVLDPVNGVFRVEPQLDPWGLADAIIHGYPENGFVPSQAGESDANRTGQDAYLLWSAGPVDRDFELAVVLTATPAAPNDTRRFHKVEILASDVGLLGYGPPITVRVYPGVMTARFAWSDDTELADAIVGSFKGTATRPITLLVNQGDVDGVARATALRVADMFLPRLAGGATVDLDPEMRPTGAMGSVTHGLVGGATVTRGLATGVRVPSDILRYAPASLRRTLLRIPDGGAS